jgi:hypothetical protein
MNRSKKYISSPEGLKRVSFAFVAGVLVPQIILGVLVIQILPIGKALFFWEWVIFMGLIFIWIRVFVPLQFYSEIVIDGERVNFKRLQLKPSPPKAILQMIGCVGFWQLSLYRWALTPAIGMCKILQRVPRSGAIAEGYAYEIPISTLRAISIAHTPKGRHSTYFFWDDRSRFYVLFDPEEGEALREWATTVARVAGVNITVRPSWQSPFAPLSMLLLGMIGCALNGVVSILVLQSLAILPD